MTTINLYQNQGEDKKLASTRRVNGGFWFSLGILVFTFLILFGLKAYIPYVEAKNVALASEINSKNKELVGMKDLEQVIDMQGRVTEIRNNLQIKDGQVTRTEMTAILDKVGEQMSSGVVISSYSYSPGKITIIFGANNFTDVSRQILNFKKADYFSDVNLASMSRGEKNIAFTLDMKIK